MEGLSGITGKHGSVHPSSEEAGLVNEKISEKKLERSANVAFGYNHCEIFRSFMFPRLLCEARGRLGMLPCVPCPGLLWQAWWARGCVIYRSPWAASQTGAIEGSGIRALCSTLNSYFLFDLCCWLPVYACRHSPASLLHALCALVLVPQHHFTFPCSRDPLYPDLLWDCSPLGFPLPALLPLSPWLWPAACPQLQGMSHQGPAVRHNVQWENVSSCSSAAG